MNTKLKEEYDRLWVERDKYDFAILQINDLLETIPEHNSSVFALKRIAHKREMLRELWRLNDAEICRITEALLRAAG